MLEFEQFEMDQLGTTKLVLNLRLHEKNPGVRTRAQAVGLRGFAEDRKRHLGMLAPGKLILNVGRNYSRISPKSQVKNLKFSISLRMIPISLPREGDW